MPSLARQFSSRPFSAVLLATLVACVGDSPLGSSVADAGPASDVVVDPGHDAAFDAPGIDASSAEGGDAADRFDSSDAGRPDPGTCFDLVRGSTETDVDCGGTCGKTCAFGKSCTANSDCKFGVCDDSVCKHSVVDVGIGGQIVCAIRHPGVLKCWGRNGFGQLGQGDVLQRGDNPATLPATFGAIDLGTGRKARAVAAGGSHVCAILDDGSVKCWGRNNVGQLGLGDSVNRGTVGGTMGDALPTVALGTGRKAVAIAAFEDFTCAILDTAAVKCWGDNAAGQLGLGDTRIRGLLQSDMGDSLATLDFGPARTVKKVRLNHNSACAILDDSSIKCWGSNAYQIPGNLNRGSAPGQMGASLPVRPLGTARTATSVAGGYAHVCAILDNGTVKCWGYNLDGRLGAGDLAMRGSDATMGDVLLPINLGAGRTAKLINSSGSNAMCAKLDNDTVKCWGLGSTGALGYGDTLTRGALPADMGNSLPVVDFGTGKMVDAMYGGFTSACVLLDDDSLKCWGDNAYGQLGLGDTNARGDNMSEMGNSLPAIAF